MEVVKQQGIHRRTFIKVGMAGAATAMIASPVFADALQRMAGPEHSAFPAPSISTRRMASERVCR